MTTRNVIQTTSLGKRYRSFWALKDCNITVPEGSVTALVGPNGAGKTTLLKLLVGLSTASTGTSTVLGQASSNTGDFIAEIGYLAQEIPLYKQFSTNDHIAMGAHLNKTWDKASVIKRIAELGIPLDRRVGKLSGGQRAQVALALALAKKPKLLLLDEPVAALDPLARVDFLSSLAQAVTEAEGNLTVVMSSHLLADLERICDHVIILAAGKTQVCDSIENVLKTHKLLIGPKNDMPKAAHYTVIQATHTPRQTTLVVRCEDKNRIDEPHFKMQNINIEEVVLAYMEQDKASKLGDAK